jgi:hypothetical protein
MALPPSDFRRGEHPGPRPALRRGKLEVSPAEGRIFAGRKTRPAAGAGENSGAVGGESTYLRFKPHD